MNGQFEQENLWGYLKRLSFIRRAISDAFPNRPPDSLHVLDVGCGTGYYLALPLASEGFQVTGIDPHLTSVSHATEQAQGLHNIKFICGYLEKLKLTEFDVVILSEVLEHVSKPADLLGMATRHLKNDGLMIVTVPNGYGEFEIDSWIFRNLGFERLITAMSDHGSLSRIGRVLRRNRVGVIESTHNCESGHIQFFTLRQLRRLFEDCSLAVYREQASSFLSGPFVSYTLGRSTRFVEWNARFVDRLPLVLASGWFFALRRQSVF